MASMKLPAFKLLLPFFLSFFIQKALAELSRASMAPDLGDICDTTQDPDFCNSVLSRSHSSSDLFYHSRFSVVRSLSQAKKFSRLLEKQLAKRSSLTQLSARALEDCSLLSGLNVDFLASTAEALDSGDPLRRPQVERAQTLLSALLTNLETCREGLQLASSARGLRSELSAAISHDTKLFSLSLALFSRAWIHSGLVPAAEFPLQSALIGEDGRLSLSMSPRNREMLESASGRRLLQSSPSSLDKIFVKTVVVVSKGNKGNFTTVGAAVASAPDNTAATGGYYLIYVAAGVYEEYVEVPKNKKYVMMVGDGIGRTIISGSRSVVDGWTTFNSATFGVLGQGFVAVNMTFRNTAGPAKHQAVAVRNGADQSAFHLCSFEAYQDTLYAHSLRQFYRQCDIYGTVDFIFGNAAAVFQVCNMYARLPMSNQKNMVTAQGRTDPNQNTGISIQGCKIRAAPDLAGSGSKIKSFLGRPWKLYSRTIIMQSFLDSLIDPAGWMPWDGDFALNTLFYGEFRNTGPAAETGSRVKWPGFHLLKSAADALNFTVSNFIDGDSWLPATGVPYSAGLA